jgi:hypothetical protein
MWRPLAIATISRRVPTLPSSATSPICWTSAQGHAYSLIDNTNNSGSRGVRWYGLDTKQQNNKTNVNNTTNTTAVGGGMAIGIGIATHNNIQSNQAIGVSVPWGVEGVSLESRLSSISLIKDVDRAVSEYRSLLHQTSKQVLFLCSTLLYSVDLHLISHSFHCCCCCCLPFIMLPPFCI